MVICLFYFNLNIINFNLNIIFCTINREFHFSSYLPCLRILRLEGNSLTKVPPLTMLPNLGELYLQENNINGMETKISALQYIWHPILVRNHFRILNDCLSAFDSFGLDKEPYCASSRSQSRLVNAASIIRGNFIHLKFRSYEIFLLPPFYIFRKKDINKTPKAEFFKGAMIVSVLKKSHYCKLCKFHLESVMGEMYDIPRKNLLISHKIFKLIANRMIWHLWMIALHLEHLLMK